MAKAVISLEDAVKKSPRKWVYLFTEGNAKMRDLLGGKGSGVAEMTNAGLPVPMGFTITTEACNEYYRDGKSFPKGMWQQTLAALHIVEEQMNKKLGDKENPLLVSVRSGAKFSMPGMMDTVLNLGLNDESVQGLIAQSGDERFAYDAYRRFVQMFSKIVLDVDPKLFEEQLDKAREKAHVKTDAELSADTLKELVGTFKKISQKASGVVFPSEPQEQLQKAIEAVFSSWNNDRAIAYRNAQKIPHDLGTAVNVQSMVFGNMGWDSGTGVAFTRDPNIGDKEIYAEYLPNAQGEDVVAGIRTPLKIESLKKEMPQVYEQFVQIARRMETHYRDMQDLEFTVEKGRLFMLQTRSGKRTAAAAVKIAVDMAQEGLITKEEAVMRVEPNHVIQLLMPQFDPAAKKQAVTDGRYLAKGLNASPGASYGKAIFDADTAAEVGKTQKVVLVRPETSPDDVHGMLTSTGILTARGGATSHAAVVARGFGLPCVAGCEAIRVDEEAKTLTVIATGEVLREYDDISIDGTTGEVFKGIISVKDANYEDQADLQVILSWADDIRRMQVWANADNPHDAEKAAFFGAQGIGLCRTEHMFFDPARLPIVQKMILSDTVEERQKALDELLPFQREDFIGLFKAMRNPKTGEAFPVVIRLLDPPLHEFLPKYEELLVEITRMEDTDKNNPELPAKKHMLAAVEHMREMNPMLGLRGCRLGLTFPEINVMQTNAILQAAIAVEAEGIHAKPKIMIPLVGHVNELAEVKRQLQNAADAVVASSGKTIEYKFGTMIELPRAAITAGQIAEVAEFFSFGTNDLTQTTFGFSRDDAEGKFLLRYVDGLPKLDAHGGNVLDANGKPETVKIFKTNPFQSIDREGVGYLVDLACKQGRAVKSDLELGVCGEHGGDPDSIMFFETTGLNYVSCSPFRVPVARLSAAQATIVANQKTAEKDK